MILLPNPRKIEIVSLPLQFFDLRRLISNKTRVAKEPVFEEAIRLRWIELDVARKEKTVFDHNVSFTTVTAFVMAEVFREVLVWVRNNLRNRKTLDLRFPTLQDLRNAF